MRRLSRFRTGLLAALVAGLTWQAHAADPATAGVSVPPSWNAYAAIVTQRLRDDLADLQDPAATRLHDFLDAQAAKDPAAPSPAPIVRLWFDAAGGIARVAFGSLGSPLADDDLRAVLLAHPIGQAPPPDMRQPLVLQLRLTYPS